MLDNFFLDSNILLYAFSTQDLKKHAVAKKLVLSENVTISSQVINEVSVNLIKKVGLKESDIEKFINSSYLRYSVITVGLKTLLLASKLREKYFLSYYDSTIVAAALESNVTTLYSEDMQHQQIIENQLTIINPFS